MERRSHERLGVRLRCLFRLAGPAGQTQEAVTENISRGGILLRWHAAKQAEVPKIGDVMKADIFLRPTTRFGQRYLRCVGEVVRISRNADGSLLMALHLRNMRLQPQAIRKAAQAAVV